MHIMASERNLEIKLTKYLNRWATRRCS